MDPILSIKDLTVTFGTGSNKTTAISHLNLDILPNQCLGIVGESGSGKSMTAMAIMQLLPVAARVSSSSQIFYHGHDLLNFSERRMREVRGKKIGMIFQDAMSALNPVLSIRQQMDEVLKTHTTMNKAARQQRATALLDEVGIHDPSRTLNAYPHQLSGGMRQRAMIAMTLCAEPDILIADEPSTALDVTIQAQVITLLKTLKEKHHATLIFISHDLAVVSQLADNIIVMQNGVKVEQASTRDFFENPQHAYSKALLNAIPSNTARHTAVEHTQPLVRVNDLKVHFPIRHGLLKRIKGYVKAVDGVSFDIPKGKTLALVGESGSGKTTTGRAIIQLLNTTAGHITFNNKNLTALSKREIRPLRKNMQIIFQDPYAALNPRMMIIDAIAEGLITQKKARSRRQAIKQVDQWLTHVDLDPDMKWRYPHEFSGGERQRICIARALALEPELLILDEPTSALDVSIQMQILQLLESLQEKLGLTYLLITHNLAVVAFMAEFLGVMSQGKLVEQGTTADILTHPQHPYTQQLLASIPTLPNDTAGQQND